MEEINAVKQASIRNSSQRKGFQRRNAGDAVLWGTRILNNSYIFYKAIPFTPENNHISQKE